MPERIPQSLAYEVVFKAFLATDHVTPATGKTIPITISKNHAGFGNPSAGATNATQIALGWYYVDLSTTDTGTLGPLIVHGEEATIDNIDIAFTVVVANIPADVKAINAVATTSVTTINANIGTTQPINFHGTGANAFQKVDLIETADNSLASAANGYLPADLRQIAGANLDTAVAQLGVNLVTIKGQNLVCAGGVTFLANVGFAGAPGANNGPPTTDGTKINQTVVLADAAHGGANASLNLGKGVVITGNGSGSAVAISNNGAAANPTINVTNQNGSAVKLESQAGSMAALVTIGSGGVDIEGTILGNLLGVIDGLSITGVATLFTVDSGETEATAVPGSLVHEISTAPVTLPNGSIGPLTFVANAIDAAAIATDAANEIADALLDRANAIETGVTPRQAMRGILTALVGVLSGAGTATITISNVGFTKNRIVATVDANGNRSVVVLDLT